MSPQCDRVAGWCPGALRAMESGDGLIVRVRPRIGRLSLAQLETLGEAARRFGNGTLYLSNRANVQIRSVVTEAHAPLLAVLKGADLIDGDPRIEAIRNVMVVPAACPQACGEQAAVLAARLEGILAQTEVLYDLPGKFGIAVQTGSAIDTGAISDVTFLVREASIAMILDGASDRAVFFDSSEAAASGFLRIAFAFLQSRRRGPAVRRMRDAVRELGLEALEREAGLQFINHGLTVIDAPAPVGSLGGAFGIGFSFGEIAQSALAGITNAMRRMHIMEAAVSPRRTIVVQVEEENKTQLRDLAGRIGAITDPADIRLRVHGCAGKPACTRATVPARRDTLEVLQGLQAAGFPKGSIHISGCEKRCAYPHRADITAIGGDGHYTITGPHDRVVRSIAQAGLADAVLQLAEAL